MNIPLLRRIQRQIDKAPLRLRMDSFREHSASSFFKDCNTAFCIAGWSIVLSGKPDFDSEDALNLSKEYLALSQDEAERLFYVRHWPKQFFFPDDSKSEESASLAIKRIDHFIATEGRE